MWQIIVLGFILLIMFFESKKEEKKIEEDIKQYSLDSTLKLYNDLKVTGMTEQQMIDQRFILPYTMNQLKERGMI